MTKDLIGHQIQHSKVLAAVFAQATEEIQSKSHLIEGVRPPNPELQALAQKKIDQVGKSRGRPLFFNYMSTGAGRGPYVELEDGSVKIDLINGIGIHILGHGHPTVIQASLRGAVADVAMQSHLQANEDYLKLLQKLVDLGSAKSNLRHAWLATCGTMANENALKIARQKNGGRMIVAMEDAFAGRSTLMAELTDNKEYKQGLPDYNEVLRIPFYDAKDSKSSEKSLLALSRHIDQHGKQISCFVFEPMLGEGGYKSAPKSFFEPLLKLCREKNIAIWFDEVQTFMRTGHMFAYETLGLGEYVDICTIAKTAQVGATLYTEAYNPKPGLIAGTFAGSSSSLSAGLAIMDFIASGGFLGPQGRIQKIHERFVNGMNRLNETTCKGLLKDAGGLGLMIAVTPLDGSKDKTYQLIKVLFKNGLICYSCGHDPYRLRFLVPAIIQDQDIDVAVKIIEQSILEMKN